MTNRDWRKANERAVDPGTVTHLGKHLPPDRCVRPEVREKRLSDRAEHLRTLEFCSRVHDLLLAPRMTTERAEWMASIAMKGYRPPE